MRRFLFLFTGVILFSASSAQANKRYALLVGSNPGWATDKPLQYAERDADRMAEVLTRFGNFSPENVVVLKNPSADDLRRHFEALMKALKADEKQGLFFFYYSGHADAGYFHLPGRPFSMAELFDSLRSLPHRLKLGVLDACQSGAIVNLKGARPTALFDVKLQDELATRGVAVLTSSGADELSQETRALSGSVFTHHFLSGLRGAADEDADKKVSLVEAYRYAADRTYLDTLQSPAGPQRPSFKFDLSGQGDVFLTSFEQKTGRVVFGKNSPSCFVVDAGARQVLAEVASGLSRPQEIALAPGKFLVKCRRPSDFQVATVVVTEKGTLFASRLKYASYPLAEGVLKGSVEDEAAKTRRLAYTALEAGEYDKAAELFDSLLTSRFGDVNAFRGKAQALLLRSESRRKEGLADKADEDVALALKAEPALRLDPIFEKRRTQASAGAPKQKTHEETKAATTSQKPQTVTSSSARRFGLGVSLVDAQGLVGFSGRWRFWNAMEVGLHVTPFNPGGGLSVRYSPAFSSGGLFIGGGARFSAVGLGWATRTSDPEIRVNESVWARNSTFDRVGFIETGIELSAHPLYIDLGVSLLTSFPLQGSPTAAFMPVISGKAFF